MNKYDIILDLKLIKKRINSLDNIEEFVKYTCFREPIYWNINGRTKYMGDTQPTDVFTVNDSCDYINDLVDLISNGFTPDDLFKEDQLFNYDRYEIGKEYAKRKRELGLQELLDSYSWEEFCDFINEPNLKVDNINKRIVLFNLKELILKKILSEHCDIFGHEFDYSKNQPSGHVCVDHYQGMTDYEWIQPHYNYECKNCSKVIKKRNDIGNLDILNSKRIDFINDEKILKSYYDSIPSYKDYYEENKPKIKVYKYTDDTRLTGKRPPYKLDNLIEI